LTPAELAAYLLRKGFDYAYDDVARLIGTSVANARQLVSRAQVHLQIPDQRAVPAEIQHLLATAFTMAARSGKLQNLERLLTLNWHPHAVMSVTGLPPSTSLGRAA